MAIWRVLVLNKRKAIARLVRSGNLLCLLDVYYILYTDLKPIVLNIFDCKAYCNLTKEWNFRACFCEFVYNCNDHFVVCRIKTICNYIRVSFGKHFVSQLLSCSRI